MSSIVSPPKTPSGSNSQGERRRTFRAATNSGGDILVPHLLIQLEDDLERAHMREAFWISVAVHVFAIIFLLLSPKIFPGLRGVTLASPADIMRNKQLTYLDMPPDAQTPPKQVKPEAKLSDKNRIAESRHPSLDKKTLEELRKAGPPKPPGPQAPPAEQQPSPQGMQAPPQPAQQAQSIPPVQDPKLALPQQSDQKPAVDFRALNATPGQQIAQAARAAQPGRSAGSFGGGGGGGDYGSGRGGSARTAGNLEVLSDTQGVDFGPYLSRVLQAVRMNWYNIIPEAARPPLLERGKVSIEFAILPDGKVAGMKIISPSGDVSLDRAAWGGITASNPFSPLPSEFHGPYLALRFHFYYNPAKGDMQ
jgi:TonB family protein